MKQIHSHNQSHFCVILSIFKVYFYITITFDQCNTVTHNGRLLIKTHRILSMKQGRGVGLEKPGVIVVNSHESQWRPKEAGQEKTDRQRLPDN